MTKKINKQRAVLNLRKEAQMRVIKDEVMRFRLEADTLARLLLRAKRVNKPAGALVREWVIEKLNQEESGHKESAEITAISIIANSLADRGLLKEEQLCQINQLLGEGEIPQDKRL